MKLVTLLLATMLSAPVWAIPVVQNPNHAYGLEKNADHNQAIHKFINTSGQVDWLKEFGTDNGKGHTFAHSHVNITSPVPEPSAALSMLVGIALVGYVVFRNRNIVDHD